MIKIDENGNIIWDRTLGSSGDDRINSIALTQDGGYLLSGDSNGSADGNKTHNAKGKSDFWVVKIDQNGSPVWDVTIGGENDEEWPVINAVNDGFIVVDSKRSNLFSLETMFN